MATPLIKPRPDLANLRVAFHLEQAREHIEAAMNLLEEERGDTTWYNDTISGLENTMIEIRSMAASALPHTVME